MKTWQSAWWLAKTELNRERTAYVLAFLLSVAFGLLTSLAISHHEYFMLDVFFLLLLPVMGMAQSSAYFSFRYGETDPFTRKLFFLRSLPVPVKVIVLSRFLLQALSHLCLIPVFFIVSYAASPTYRETLPPGQLIMFMIMWIGYSLLVGGLYHFLELSISGKALLWASFGMTLLLMIGATILRLFNGSLVEWTINLAQGGPLLPIAIFLTGLASVTFWYTATQRRVMQRDLYIMK